MSSLSCMLLHFTVKCQIDMASPQSNQPQKPRFVILKGKKKRTSIYTSSKHQVFFPHGTLRYSELQILVLWVPAATQRHACLYEDSHPGLLAESNLNHWYLSYPLGTDHSFHSIWKLAFTHYHPALMNSNYNSKCICAYPRWPQEDTKTWREDKLL